MIVVSLTIFVLFRNLSYISDPDFISLSLAAGLVTDPIAFGPRLLRGRGGLAFFSDRIGCEVSSWRKDSNGRIPSILLVCGNTEINVVNIYAPTN